MTGAFAVFLFDSLRKEILYTTEQILKFFGENSVILDKYIKNERDRIEREIKFYFTVYNSKELLRNSDNLLELLDSVLELEDFKQDNSTTNEKYNKLVWFFNMNYAVNSKLTRLSSILGHTWRTFLLSGLALITQVGLFYLLPHLVHDIVCLKLMMVLGWLLLVGALAYIFLYISNSIDIFRDKPRMLAFLECLSRFRHKILGFEFKEQKFFPKQPRGM